MTLGSAKVQNGKQYPKRKEAVTLRLALHHIEERKQMMQRIAGA